LILYILIVHFFFCSLSNSVARLAQQYLAIPASQASCERLFSIARNDITEKRTSLNPDLVEALIFIAKRKEILSG
jgi:hypothetical protein